MSVVLSKDKACMWYDTLKRNREGRGLGHIRTWKLFKELFFNKLSFLPCNFNSSMHQSLYRLRQGSMAITKFKLKFDEYVAYFSSWTENDRIELFVKYIIPKR